MEESILMSIRKLVCGNSYADHFDEDLLMHINSCFSILMQLGVGPTDGFIVTDETQTWTDFTNDTKELNMVRTYVTLKVKSIFDPPLTSSVLEAMNRQISELEWRLNVAGDSAKTQAIASTQKYMSRRRKSKSKIRGW